MFVHKSLHKHEGRVIKKVKFIVVGGLCAIGLVLSGCTSSEVSTTADDNGSQGSKGDSKKAPARVGQAITVKGMEDGSQVTVTAIKVVDTAPADEFSTVEKGKRLVAVQFLIKNSGKGAYDDSPSNGAKVIDGQDQQYESDIMVDKIKAGPMLPSGLTIPPGGQARGFLTFQVPQQAKIKAVQFAMDSGFSNAAQWTLG